MLKVNTFSTYTTSDGKEFKDEAKAVAHQTALNVKARVDAYVATLSFPKAKTELGQKLAARAVAKTVGAFLAWSDAEAAASANKAATEAVEA
jgi:hypothetical protein